MSELIKKECSSDLEKPAANSNNEDNVFPPFPEPDDIFDFDDDISDEEKKYIKEKFANLKTVSTYKLHCTACDKHLGCASVKDSRMKMHPMLRTLICQPCHTFYNSGEFDKGDDGSELYCRWCGQGGQVYCCSDCPHVFCAKCIKRNMGLAKIKEIENTDDWKCFKCNPKCLWDLRAICWALLRYCYLKNKITAKTENECLKEAYLKDCDVDYSECCKYKKRNSKKKEEKKEDNPAKQTPSPARQSPSHANIIAKIPSTIQVKKFASVFDDSKPEKKIQKRPLEKPNIVKNPVPIAPIPKFFNMMPGPPMPKRMRMPNSPQPFRFPDRSPSVRAYQPQRFNARPPQGYMPMPMLTFNGLANSFNTSIHNDNINLSLDSLTQGLDMASVQAINDNDDLVCTPDLPPLEPLCEVMEDNTDDDVECMTPAPSSAKKNARQVRNTVPDLTNDNIIQMTENDVTVNKLTGGLKFRVDPQTLSSNKMYRLPDGRVFAITANPNMPAGYSATIVAVTETNNKVAKGPGGNPKVFLPKTPNTPKPRKRPNKANTSTNKRPQIKKVNSPANRACDLDIPVEWFRYNLIDAVDTLDYSQSRLEKLKKEASTTFLRTRTVDEMKYLHKRLENLLNTSIARFTEIKGHLADDFKLYISKKQAISTSDDDIDDDDDDVEILPNNDDPIFIDENSVDSVTNNTQDIDATNADKYRSENEIDDEINDSTTIDADINVSAINDSTTIINSSKSSTETNKDDHDKEQSLEESNEDVSIKVNGENTSTTEIDVNVTDNNEIEKNNDINDKEGTDGDLELTSEKEIDNVQDDDKFNEDTLEDTPENNTDKEPLKETSETTTEEPEKPMEIDQSEDTKKQQLADSEKSQDTEISDELINDLLKDDAGDDTVTSLTNSLDIGDLEP